LKQHKLIHTERKKYVCDVCNKKFTTPGYFTKHKLIHTEQKESCV
jgi:uncharacterized Zn-finger protein